MLDSVVVISARERGGVDLTSHAIELIKQQKSDLIIRCESGSLFEIK